MIYRETYIPRLSDYDRDGKLSYTSLLCLLEDIGSHHSTYADDDIMEGSRAGIAWVCTNWHIFLKKRPVGGEALHISTWVRAGRAAATILRDFRVCDETGTELVLAESRCALLDIKSGRPVRISEELLGAYEPEEKAVFDTEMKRVAPLKEYDLSVPVPIRKSDIDFNGHVHNTRYMELALEGIRKGILFEKDVKEIYISYRRPVAEGDSVFVKCTEKESGYLLSISNDGGPCCLAELYF